MQCLKVCRNVLNPLHAIDFQEHVLNRGPPHFMGAAGISRQELFDHVLQVLERARDLAMWPSINAHRPDTLFERGQLLWSVCKLQWTTPVQHYLARWDVWAHCFELPGSLANGQVKDSLQVLTHVHAH